MVTKSYHNKQYLGLYVRKNLNPNASHLDFHRIKIASFTINSKAFYFSDNLLGITEQL